MAPRVTSHMCTRQCMKSMFEDGQHKYTPPPWLRSVASACPSHKCHLIMEYTPIHELDIPNVPSDFSLHIKRDDMTGCSLSGNKIRKLEFLFADAVLKGFKHIVTYGGVQSNYCRATAVAGKQLGFTVHILLLTHIEDAEDIGCRGNLLQMRMAGAHLYFIPKEFDTATQLQPKLQEISENIMKEYGEESYIVPLGGSNHIGMFGYIKTFQELLQQDVANDFDDIIFTCGSGGTGEGLAIANHLSGAGLKIHGIVIKGDADQHYSHMTETLDKIGLGHLAARDMLHLIDGHNGEGYGNTTPEKLDFIAEVSMSTGIMLDPTYTGKALYGLLREMETKPEVFSGRRLLFLHTGGLFGLYTGKIDDTVMKHSQSLIHL